MTYTSQKDNQTTEVITTKPGYTTTEFWVTAITTVLSLVMSFHPGFHVDSTLIPSLALIAAALSSGLYSLSRAKAKVG